MRQFIKRFVRDEDAATALEYAVISGLITAVMMVGALKLGKKTNKVPRKVSDAIDKLAKNFEEQTHKFSVRWPSKAVDDRHVARSTALEGHRTKDSLSRSAKPKASGDLCVCSKMIPARHRRDVPLRSLRRRD